MRVVFTSLRCLGLLFLATTGSAYAQGDGHFDWPLVPDNISQKFGNLDGPTVGSVYTCARAHAGVDFAGNTDTVVHAVADGDVLCEYNDPGSANDGYPGRVVVVRHHLPDNRTVYSMYGHLDFCPPNAGCVAVGANVRRGDPIGSLYAQPGNTHLHFELREFPYWDYDNKRPTFQAPPTTDALACAGRGYAEENSTDGSRNGLPDVLDPGYLNPIDFIFSRLPPLSNSIEGPFTLRAAPDDNAAGVFSLPDITPVGVVHDSDWDCPMTVSGSDGDCTVGTCPTTELPPQPANNRKLICENRRRYDCSNGACDWWYEVAWLPPWGGGTQTAYVKAYTPGAYQATLSAATPYTAQALPAWQDSPDPTVLLHFGEEQFDGRRVPNLGLGGAELDGDVLGALVFSPYVPNFPDRTLLLDGASSEVRVRNGVGWDLAQGFSWKIAVRRDSDQTEDQVIGQWGSTTASQTWMVSFVNAGGAAADNRRELQFKLRPAGGEPVVARYVLPDCDYVGRWNDIAGRYDAANNWIELYWRGRLVSRRAFVGAPAAPTTLLILGGSTALGGQNAARFDGALDVFRMWGTWNAPPSCLDAGGTCTPLPDLQPTAIQLPAATTLYEGQSLSFSAGVGNNGSVASPDFGVRWRVDGANLASGTHAGVPPYGSVGGQPAGSFTWTAVAGEHLIEFVVDPANTVQESAEGNNVGNRLVGVSPLARPDLVPGGLAHQSCDLAAGESVRFDSSVRNDGDAGSPGFQVQWRVDAEEAGPPRAHPGVPAGQTVDDDATLFDWLAIAGTHSIELGVDTGNQVGEALETNNVRRVTVSVPDALRADLRPTTIRILGSLVPGQLVTFDSGVRNLGRGSSGIFNVRWLVDGQDVGAAGSHADVPPGATVLNDNSAFDWTVLSGPHTIGFELDYDHQVEECNETNNRLTKPVNGAPSSVDLLPAGAPKLASGQLFAGNAVVVNAAVRNAGSDASDEFLVQWLVDSQVRRSGLHEPLPGGVTVGDGNSQFVWVAEPGRHVIGFLVDADNRVDETREDNNFKTLTLDVPFERPDLKPTAIKVPAASLFVGNPVTFDSGVQNLGPGDSDAFNVRWLVDGVALGEGQHGGVPAGATVLDDNSQLPWIVTPGSHVVTFVVDSGQHVAELNEGNNVAQSSFQASAAPRADLKPTVVRATPSAPEAGDLVRLDSGVRNTGVAPSGTFNVLWQIDGVTRGEGSHVNVPPGTTVANDNSFLDWSATAGSHVVTFTVDSGNHVPELNETNNRATLTLGVEGVPDVVLGPFPVSAQANIFGAGASSGPYGGGAPPALVALPPGSGRVLTFSVTGSAISCCGTAGAHGPDGGAGLQTSIVSSTSPISGVRHYSRNIFLLGVALDASAPAGGAPAPLAYFDPLDGGSVAGAASTQAPQYAAVLRQSFFIGDGAGTPGLVQRFSIPDSATRLFMGFADGLNLGDPTLGTPSPAEPGLYIDNTGSLSVTVTVTH